MQRGLQVNLPWKSYLQWMQYRRLAASATGLTKRPSADIEHFQKRAFLSEEPYLIRPDSSTLSPKLPASSKWFENQASGASFSSYMNKFSEQLFPFELVTPSPQHVLLIARFQNWLLESHDVADQILAGALMTVMEEMAEAEREFFQFYAPLKLLFKVLEFNERARSETGHPLRLYIAQSLLTDLPQALQDDLPTPEIVKTAGKGDIYSSSIWLGTEPTYTPLHRDPNPNLFCQLCSSKVVRMLSPGSGDAFFRAIQARTQKHGNGRIRGAEMMEGVERAMLHDEVWQSKATPTGLLEIKMDPGDALFIPKGWWHSVKSQRSNGYLNGSANWWFR